jgi:hypothetical protein
LNNCGLDEAKARMCFMTKPWLPEPVSVADISSKEVSVDRITVRRTGSRRDGANIRDHSEISHFKASGR